jgi:dihydrofolate synthase / folylpolyglutamate synthase
VVDPVVSVITNIGYDHMNLLGDTLQKIAAEKAGIIKAKKPVVISQYQPQISQIFTDKARELKATIEYASKDLKVVEYKRNGTLNATVTDKRTGRSDTYELDLTGTYQLKNLPGVLTALRIISDSGFFMSEENIKRGLRNVSKLTGLQGRWQILEEKPLMICDTGHNEDGIKEVLENLKSYSYKQLHFVLGVVNDKDISSILKLLPGEAVYYFTKANIPRALPEQELQEKAKEYDLKGETFPNVKAAIAAAKKKAKANDLIFIGGSTFVVADALS